MLDESEIAKYAEMDKDVEAASNIELNEGDSEDSAREPSVDYSQKMLTLHTDMKQQTEKQSTTPPRTPKHTAGYSTLTSAKKIEEVKQSIIEPEPIVYNGKVIPGSINVIVD